jgi:hypothetical protein
MDCVSEVMLAASSPLTISIPEEIITIVGVSTLPTHPQALPPRLQALVNIMKSSGSRTVRDPNSMLGIEREGG